MEKQNNNIEKIINKKNNDNKEKENNLKYIFI
jgi:hypothetical protein